MTENRVVGTVWGKQPTHVGQGRGIDTSIPRFLGTEIFS